MLFRSILFSALAAIAVATNSGIYDDDGRVASVAVRRRSAIPIENVERDTNGDRLRRGLPPKAPQSVRRRRGKVEGRQCVTSPIGTLQVISTSGTVLGYIRNTFDGQNSYTYGTLANALRVYIPAINSTGFGSYTDIRALNGPDAAHPLVGAVGGSGGYNFNSGQLGYAYLSGVGHTNANSPPSFSAGNSIQSLGYNGPSESMIWKVNCAGNVIAQWTNVDGSQPSTSIYYDPSVDFVGLVGDYSKFMSTFPSENAQLVTLKFIPG